MDIIGDSAGLAATPAPAAIVEVAPAAPAAPKRDWLVLVAVLLAALAAVMSSVGLAVASRTVAEARNAIAALKTHPPAAPAEHHPAPPVSADDPAPLRADRRDEIAALRADIARSRGEANLLATQVRGAQAELANRMSTMLLKLDRIDRGAGGHGAGGE